MSGKNLAELLRGGKTAVELLRNQQTGPNAYPGVPAEYTNWRDEQMAWQKTCVLFNQSYHMADLKVEGRDATKLLSYLGINSFENFPVDRGKQFVPCSPEGYVIGDVILFHLAEQEYNLVGRAPTLNWVQFHAATGGFDVNVELDERTARRTDPTRRKSYRFQLQGPNAMKVIEGVTGEAAPQIKFFNMTRLAIAGRSVRALRHGMAGQPGFELFGPWEEGEEIRQALIEAGATHGMRLVGGRAYSSNTIESGWIPSPLPAVYTGDGMQAYREWLPATGYEGTCSLGGSFDSPRIEDYYLNPWELGYGNFVKFDHDFIGRAALERMAKLPHRRKVTLALDGEDVTRVLSSMFQKTDRAKYLDFPSAVYAMHPYDRVRVGDKTVGMSTWIGYSANEGRMLTLAMLDPEHAQPGTRVNLLWGEAHGGSTKPTVEPHVQTEIAATVSPVPYSEVARDAYADSWRNRKG